MFLSSKFSFVSSFEEVFIKKRRSLLSAFYSEESPASSIYTALWVSLQQTFEERKILNSGFYQRPIVTLQCRVCIWSPLLECTCSPFHGHDTRSTIDRYRSFETCTTKTAAAKCLKTLDSGCSMESFLNFRMIARSSESSELS